MNNADILVAGVGGQGTLLASNILSEVGMRAGYDVKKSDVLGLSVRGGSVLSHVRWGRDVASPVVPQGSMTHMLAFEPLEALRGLHLMNHSARVLCNAQPIPPVSVSSGDWVYPNLASVEAQLRRETADVQLIAATMLAMDMGNPRVTNVIMLGAFSTYFDIDLQIWLDVVLAGVPAKHAELNGAAFNAGRGLRIKESS
jgi:indolepyruvate ferredoxin oxidoreductase, beta subunit